MTVEAVRAIQWQVAHAAELGPQSVDALVAATLNVAPGQAATVGAFGQVSTPAVAQLVGQLQAASPLAKLPGLNREAVQQMGRELTRGLVNGEHSRVIGRRIAAVTDIPAARAATIARTETHRAYREAGRLAMIENPLVHEWIWHASTTARTCAACWAMHGQIFPTDQPMGSHPNCRCTMLPKVTPPAWMDAPEVVYPSGEVLFDALPVADQRTILGPDKYHAFEQGRLRLGDVVKETETREWGTTRSVASLKDSLAAH